MKTRTILTASVLSALLGCKTTNLADSNLRESAATTKVTPGIKILSPMSSELKVGKIINEQQTDDAIYGVGAIRPQRGARMIIKGSCQSSELAGFEVSGSDLNGDRQNDIIGRMSVVWKYDLKPGEKPLGVLSEQEFKEHMERCEKTKSRGVLQSVSLHHRVNVGTNNPARYTMYQPLGIMFASQVTWEGNAFRGILTESSSSNVSRSYCASTLDAAGIKHRFTSSQLCDFELVRMTLPPSALVQPPLKSGEAVQIHLRPTSIYAYQIATVSQGEKPAQGDARLVLAPPSAAGRLAQETVLIKSNFKKDSAEVESAKVYLMKNAAQGSAKDFTIDEDNQILELFPKQSSRIEVIRPARPVGSDLIELGESTDESVGLTQTLWTNRIECERAFAMVQRAIPTELKNRDCALETDAGVSPSYVFNILKGNDAKMEAGRLGIQSLSMEEMLYDSTTGFFGSLGVGGAKGYNRGLAIDRLLVIIRVL
jgi:hypothetical protein